MFSMKKLLKKIFMFGISAATTLSFCQPVVEGRAPSASDRGIQLNSSVSIDSNATNVPTASITLASNLQFNGALQKLISSVNYVTMNDTDNTHLNFESGTSQQVKVYLRVGAGWDMPTSQADWVEYSNANSLNDDKLKRKDVGSYYVYYYVDGLGNIQDNGANDGGSATPES